jgi:hypothetical protein
LRAAGLCYAPPDGGRLLSAGRCGPIVGGQGGDRDRQVEAVQERTGEFL